MQELGTYLWTGIGLFVAFMILLFIIGLISTWLERRRRDAAWRERVRQEEVRMMQVEPALTFAQIFERKKS